MADKNPYYDRDLSWLAFNYRVLQEASDLNVPLYDRIMFLAIYSSNLDEFFRVRVASLQSLKRLGKKKVNKNLDIKPKKMLKKIHEVVGQQLDEFGKIFRNELLPALKDEGIRVYFNEPIPEEFISEIAHFFRSRVLAYIQPHMLVGPETVGNMEETSAYFKNKSIYLAVNLQQQDDPDQIWYACVNIPSDKVGRFYQIKNISDGYHILMLDDIVRAHLDIIFQGYEVLSSYSIKLNKNADLNIEDEFTGDLVEKIAEQINKREIGMPSRFLYDMDINPDLLSTLAKLLNLSEDELVSGGKYHNINDFMKLPNPLKPRLEQVKFPPIKIDELDQGNSIFEVIQKKDCIAHFPYQSYDYVLRFFNEAAIDPEVTEIKVTLYRIAGKSLIANALISAVNNGKKVTVFVEVKARFDEENNIRWAKKMENAGVTIIYSIPGLKVHAKVALVKRRGKQGKVNGYAFFGTGNFNENTASIYADHGLLTCNPSMIQELDEVFKYLHKRNTKPAFQHLLVSQFNLKNRFLKLIDREIDHAKAGREAGIIIKLNNLEEHAMIDKLYEANNAGVNIKIINRGICCLVPGMAGFSENIKIFRLVDMYLEHARIFIFKNNGENDMFLSSADWMTRNLHHRIEVGFPIYDPDIKSQLLRLIDFQLDDRQKLRQLNSEHEHLVIENSQLPTDGRAQVDFYEWLKNECVVT